jgi:hypothetical protein
LIFYGRGWKPDVIYRLQHFVRKLDQTKYFGVLKTYRDENGSVTGPVILNETVWTDYELVRPFSL